VLGFEKRSNKRVLAKLKVACELWLLEFAVRQITCSRIPPFPQCSRWDDSFFPAEFGVVFCIAKCVAIKGVALVPPLLCMGI